MNPKHQVWILAIAVVVGAVLLPPALAAQDDQMPAAVKTSKLADGTVILTDAKGMTLYTYDKDAGGKSVCNATCAKNWPPLAAAADAKAMGAFTVITRDDGSHQWAYKGKPLYGWVKDAKPGDTTGHNVGAWKMAVR